ncbi:hypothetical protein IW145_003750, partial [Coemansia sp. RSA 521]
MKLAVVSTVAALLSVARAHYECTTQEAFDVLFSNTTTDALAQRLLNSLKEGTAEIRGRTNNVDAERAAQHILTRYRTILGILPKNIAA